MCVCVCVYLYIYRPDAPPRRLDIPRYGTRSLLAWSKKSFADRISVSSLTTYRGISLIRNSPFP